MSTTLSAAPARASDLTNSAAHQGRSPARVAVGYLAVLLVALAIDLVTKSWAVSALAAGAVVLTDSFALMLIFNSGLAGGASIGPLTWPVNMVTTVASILLVSSVVYPLAQVSPRATLAMGLIAGGASGNLVSLVAEPRGVPDFLAVHVGSSALVFNMADVALWLGAGILVPITVGLFRTIRAQERRGSREVVPQ